MANLSLVVIESDEFLRNSICSQLEATDHFSVDGIASDPVTGQRTVAQQHPDVVILEVPQQAPQDALALSEWLRVEHPETVVLGASSTAKQDLLRLAMRAGIQDLLQRPIDPGQLTIALQHALQQKLRRQRVHERRGEVTVLFGIGGGIGTTTVATNAAVRLAGIQDAPVVLMDLDLNMGNIPCFLDLAPTPGYLNVLKDIERLDGEGLRQYLPRHDSGVYMLAGPQAIEDLEAVRPDDLGRVLDLCRESFKHVVVDAGHCFDDRRTEVLDRADRILVVTQLNVAAMHAARRNLDTLNRLGFADDQIEIIATRVGRGSQVSPEDVEQSLGHPIAFSVPNDYPSAIHAIDSGVPIMSGRGRGRTAASFKKLADALTRPIAIEPASPNGATTTTTNGKANGSKTSGPVKLVEGRRQGPISRIFRGLSRGSDQAAAS